MGLFDSIHCDHPLPGGRQETDFQSKSLGCWLHRFRLTAGGRLLHADGRDTAFHGVFRFGTWLAAEARWLEYEAKFTDGQLQHLRTAEAALYDDRGFAAGAEDTRT